MKNYGGSLKNPIFFFGCLDLREAWKKRGGWCF